MNFIRMVPFGIGRPDYLRNSSGACTPAVSPNLTGTALLGNVKPTDTASILSDTSNNMIIRVFKLFQIVELRLELGEWSMT